MKLTDLNPRWALDADIWVCGTLVHDTERKGMGLTFQCPCCVGTERATRLGIFFKNPTDGKAPSDDAPLEWTRTGETFEDLSLTPSIDVSKSGHWHGYITNGQIT